MKFVSFESANRTSFGLLRDDAIVDLGARLPFASLAELIAGGGLEAARACADAAPDIALADARLLKPLDRWPKCFCIGVNYPDRNAEYRDGSEAPKYPSVFIRFPDSFTGPDMPLVRPPESPQLDYEGEIALVVGKGGRRIPQSAWREHVFGMTLANEGTIRDWVRHGKFNVTPGKNWPSTGALGPFIATLDELPDRFRLTTRVNGEVRQDGETALMMFPFARIVEYVSTFCALEPGDVILTGTPSGAGARFDPPRWLAPGDVVEIAATGLGLLRNSIADESAAG